MAGKHWADTGSTDSDRDGLSDEFERNVVGTDPHDRDSDDDGLNDNRERDFGTNPLDPDTDDDAIPDLREVIVGSNPHSKDSDQDTVPDLVELRHGTLVAPDSNRDGTPDWVDAARDPTLDSDGDGLSDGEERWLRTNPNSMHTDSDFVEDFYEVAIGEDPRTPERGPQGQPIPGVPKGPVPPPDPVYPMPPYDPNQPIRPGVPNPLPGGPQALIDSKASRSPPSARRPGAPIGTIRRRRRISIRPTSRRSTPEAGSRAPTGTIRRRRRISIHPTCRRGTRAPTGTIRRRRRILIHPTCKRGTATDRGGRHVRCRSPTPHVPGWLRGSTDVQAAVVSVAASVLSGAVDSSDAGCSPSIHAVTRSV
jgi:Bacterial TSP3 repeat